MRLGRSVTYTYLNGMLQTNIWARSVWAWRAYNQFGEITEMHYSDGTPSVYFDDFNRAGLPRSITDASGTSVLAYDHANRLISVTGQEGGLFPGIVVSNHFHQVYGRDLLQVLNLNVNPRPSPRPE